MCAMSTFSMLNVHCTMRTFSILNVETIHIQHSECRGQLIPVVVVGEVTNGLCKSFRVACTMEGPIDQLFQVFDIVETKATAAAFGKDIPSLVDMALGGGTTLESFLQKKQVAMSKAASAWSVFGYTRGKQFCKCKVDKNQKCCATNRCPCKKTEAHYCNSNCHGGVPCQNRDPRDT